MARTKQPKVPPRHILEARMREAKAVQLRIEGHKYREIAEQLGYDSSQHAYDAVARAYKRAVTDSEAAAKQVELDRLDDMHRSLWPRAVGGDDFAMDRVLKTMDRRTKLLGLDQPLRIDHGVEIVLEIHGDEVRDVTPAPVDTVLGACDTDETDGEE